MKRSWCPRILPLREQPRSPESIQPPSSLERATRPNILPAESKGQNSTTNATKILERLKR